jgi:cytochrome c
MKMKQTYQAGALLLAMALVSCTDSAKETTRRDRDPWVFRSVLDQKPRMLTMALHKDLWASYDTQSGLLYKVWQGGVNFDGAVYTAVHGPQPTSQGSAFIADTTSTGQWELLRNGQPVPAKFQYLGHVFTEKGSIATLEYKLSTDDGLSVIIKEKPEFKVSKGQPGFERVFQTEGVPEGVEVKLYTQLASLPATDAYSSSGNFEVKEAKTQEHSFGQTHTVNGVLSLGANTSTTLSCYFDRRVSSAK